MNRLFGYIYVIINLLDGKQYVGQRKCTFDSEDDKYFGSGKILVSAIKKHGRENFKKQILRYCKNQEELDTKETFYIKQRDCLSPKGYNICETAHGGAYLNNHPDREEICKKISNSLLGYKHTDESNQKKSLSKMNIPRTESTKLQISRTKLLTPRIFTKEEKLKNAQTRRDNGSYKSSRKGKTHVEIFGVEVAASMRRVNSDKHKRQIE